MKRFKSTSDLHCAESGCHKYLSAKGLRIMGDGMVGGSGIWECSRLGQKRVCMQVQICGTGHGRKANAEYESTLHSRDPRRQCYANGLSWLIHHNI